MNWLSIVVALLIAPALEPEKSLRRIELGEAVLVLPAGYRPRAGRADLIITSCGFWPLARA